MTEDNPLTVDPFPFTVPDNHNAVRYGNYLFMVVLPDGREVEMYAGQVTISPGGVLEAWQTHTPGQTYSELRREAPEEREPLEQRKLLLALPRGSWVNVYAASILDMSPVCVGSVPAPPGRAGRLAAEANG